MAERMAEVGRRALRSFMPEQHRLFFAQLPFLAVGSVDAAGAPWASILNGLPGFARSPDPVTLTVKATIDPGDPLARSLGVGAALGLLGIELPTLRRNRVNGHVAAVEPQGFALAVDQSFGNCPQYIHRRDYAEPVAARHRMAPIRVERFTGLDPEAASLIARADTCFVATSAVPRGRRMDGVDVSHRGGLPGFLRLDVQERIVLPDYRGNFFFNTFGNLMVNPRLGVTLVDFESGDLLQLTGTADIVWEGPELAAHPGAQRLCRITPIGGQWQRGGFPLRLTLKEVSRQALAVQGQGGAPSQGNRVKES